MNRRSNGTFVAEPLPERLASWSRVDVHGCRLWLGHVDPKTGYGQIKIGTQTRSVHRVAAEAAGMAVKGTHVLHRCDIRRCIEPTHLFLGTAKDNQADMTSKGRGRVGERNGQAKLTESQVREIRVRFAAGETATSLAPQYNVSQPLVSAIARGALWNYGF